MVFLKSRISGVWHLRVSTKWDQCDGPFFCTKLKFDRKVPLSVKNRQLKNACNIFAYTTTIDYKLRESQKKVSTFSPIFLSITFDLVIIFRKIHSLRHLDVRYKDQVISDLLYPITLVAQGILSLCGRT